MTKNGILKALVFLALLAGVSTGAFAQLTISGGFALSTMAVNLEGSGTSGITIEGGMGLGGNIYFDYLLPINIPLSLGAEIGADSSSFTIKAVSGLGTESFTDQVMALPLLLRAAYHFDLDPKLDLFLVGKIGYAIGFIVAGPDKEDLESAGGIGFGIDIGAAYYFTSLFGAFAEVGFDDYSLDVKFRPVDYTISAPFYRFATLGLSFRK
jgi:hypothetical protein